MTKVELMVCDACGEYLEKTPVVVSWERGGHPYESHYCNWKCLGLDAEPSREWSKRGWKLEFKEAAATPYDARGYDI